ncbi:MAG: hypothetical protein ABL997_08660 [Planctomycetota bacterium]
MDTTVTGMFPDHRAASVAADRLVKAGFRTEQVRVVSAFTGDRHQFIDAKTTNARRAVMLGTAFSAVGGSVAGALLASVLDMALSGPLVMSGMAGAIGGGLLGLVVGRSTKSQIQDELEHQVDAGTVLVGVVTDDKHVESALNLLSKEGASSVVSTATSFTASVLPSTPET